MKLRPYLKFIFFCLNAMMLCLSCRPNMDAAAEDVIYYYPEKNVYYDSLQSNYYYSLNGGKTWDSLAFSNANYDGTLGTKISIKRTGDSAWANNESDRKQYNGVLLNVINNYTIALSRADRINKLKAVVKAATQPKVIEKPEPPPEKGLKKFFHKLFGKKKKPAEEAQP